MLNKLAELKKDRKNKKKRHFLYEFFNPKGSGKGLSKEEARQPRNFVNFFKFYSRNFNTMFALNVFAFLGNFPILFGLYALTQNLNVNTTAPASSMFGPLYGAMTAGGANPISAALFGVHGAQARISLPTTATYVFFGLTALVFLTFGVVNLATAYVMRNIVKGDPSMLFSDIKYSIKRNWKQGMLLGVIDLLFILVIAYDLFFFYAGSISAVMGFMLGVMVIVAMIYTMMRYYMYIMLVTFDLSIYKILKNSFIFAILGFRRNIVAFLGAVAVALFDYWLLITVFPVGIILPTLILVSLVGFMGIYAAYPKVKEVMIDPYYVSDNVGAKKRGEEEDEAPEEEPIFRDRG